MSTPVIALDHPAAMHAARVGHEAAALAVARAAGLPAVRGVVLTADWAAHDRRTADLVWRITSHDGLRPLVVRPSDVVRRRHHGEAATMAPMTLANDVDELLDAAAALRADGHDSAPVLVHPAIAGDWHGALFVDDCSGRRSSPVVVARAAGSADDWIAALDDAGRIRDRVTPETLPPSSRLLGRLMRVAARAAGELGGPQDLEWTADADDRLSLLRVRPIVRLRASDAPSDRHHRTPCRPAAAGWAVPRWSRSAERTRESDRRVA